MGRAGAWLVPKHDIPRDRQQLADGEVLEHGRDPELPRNVRVAQDSWAAIDLDGAAGRLVHARENLDERGFAGAVVAQQSQDTTGACLQRDVPKRHDGLELLGDVADGHHRDLDSRDPDRASPVPADVGVLGHRHELVPQLEWLGVRRPREGPLDSSGALGPFHHGLDHQPVEQTDRMSTTPKRMLTQ